MNTHWRLLSWEYACDQSQEVQEAHMRASESAEYGVNFYEFVNTAEGLTPMVQRWWDSLPADRQAALLRERVSELRERVGLVEQAINTYEK